MGRAYPDQLAEKHRHAQDLLAGFPGIEWLPPFSGPESGYRNKAKMVVGGTVDAPTIGILDTAGGGVDLTGCGICSPGIRAVFPALATFVTTARLQPYSVPERRGELKYLLLTESPDGELAVRFVLRSQESVSRIRKHLPSLLDALPQVTVVSVNLQPEHKAVFEGPVDLPLTEQDSLPMRTGEVVLHLRARSFFQTNTVVATELYRQATEWAGDLAPRSVWDLYCGVGGFALHLAAAGRTVVGVESSEEAIGSALISARERPGSLRFEVGDATAFALGSRREQRPDLVVVNPPRRGIGPELAGWLQGSGIRSVLYSSCNAVTLARDLAAMPALRPVRARVLDMFPQTTHYEVLVELRRGR
nr:23S rRNA (uracil(747)-C(5))-methyltransferase RlmC [Nakamurella alba]